MFAENCSNHFLYQFWVPTLIICGKFEFQKYTKTLDHKNRDYIGTTFVGLDTKSKGQISQFNVQIFSFGDHLGNDSNFEFASFTFDP